MLDNNGFDLWADGYDRSVDLSEESNTYPFAGYRNVLGHIYTAIRKSPGTRVLDIGFGTGVLTSRLYADGYAVTGIDFSQRMIEIAREKMPEAVLIQYDFSHGLPETLQNQTFDAIVCTYAIHHLTDPEKLRFLSQWKARLNPGGTIYLGDVAFATRADLERCRKASGEEWDEEEIYLVADEIAAAFPDARFQQLSHCAGVLTLTPDEALTNAILHTID